MAIELGQVWEVVGSMYAWSYNDRCNQLIPLGDQFIIWGEESFVNWYVIWCNGQLYQLNCNQITAWGKLLEP